VFEQSSVVPALLAWFAENARDLPWRRTTDPYAIWISEVMLQQTQVQTVIPYWERWMKALPNVRRLARAAPDRVLKLWEGLGYYGRARNLQRAAQALVDQHGSVLPNTYDALLQLPGIGRYTAGAICSIAFDQPTPILDGNVLRVLTRLYGISQNVRSKRTNARLWREAQRLVFTAAQARDFPGRRCSMLNQALMELGAVLCTPRQPRCPACPVNDLCVAHRTGVTERLPNLGPRTASTPRSFMAFVVRNRGRFLVRQRPAGVVNAGFWEFPNVEVIEPTDHLGELARRCLGCEPKSLRLLCVIRHAITRFRVRMEAYEGPVDSTPHQQERARWCTLPQLHNLALASAHRKVLDRLRLERSAP
jgi:A/G-specific adenine glycosylase